MFAKIAASVLLFLNSLLGQPVDWEAKNPDNGLVLSSQTSTFPTPTPTVKPTVKVVPVVKNDGSRSGAIIKYKEWCTGKEINVYANEVITKVSPKDGKTYGMTQGDWDCYLRTTPTNTPSVNTPSTTTSTTTPYVPKTYYVCTLCYYNSCSTYDHLYETKAECDVEQTRLNSVFSRPTPTPVPYIPTYTTEQCREDVRQRFEPAFQSCNQYGATSARDACIEMNTNSRNNALAACG